MELKEFISRTLSDIVAGVRHAEKDLKDDVALCYHTNKEYDGYPSLSYKSSLHDYQAPLTVVGFKINICVEDVCTSEGKVSSSILSVLGGAVGGRTGSSSAETQEVTFSIPLVWKKKDK